MNGTVGKTAITQKIPNAIHPSTTLEVPANAILANPLFDPLQLKLLTIALQEPVTTHKLKESTEQPPDTNVGQTRLTIEKDPALPTSSTNFNSRPCKIGADTETMDINQKTQR